MILLIPLAFGLDWLCRAVFQWKLDSDRERARRALERQQRTVTPFDDRRPERQYHNDFSWLQERRRKLRLVQGGGR